MSERGEQRRGVRPGQPRRTITAELEQLAMSRGEAVLIHWVDSARETTYAEMYDAAVRRADSLRAVGVGEGDRVALMSTDGYEFLAYLFATMLLGAIAAPIGVELRGESLRRPLSLYTPRAVVVEEDLQDLVSASIAGLESPPGLLVTTDGAGVAGTAAADRRWTERRLSDPCLIMSTSGTTGPSKGSLWDYGTVETWAKTYVRHLGYTPADRIYCCTPLSHANALVTGVMAAIYAGGSVALSTRFSVRNFWRDIASSGSTTANLLGSMIHLLLAHEESLTAAPTSGLRTFLVSSCSATAYHRVREEWGVIPVCAYGLTDFGTLTASDAGEPCPPGSCGRAVDGFELRLVDADEHEVAVGEVGELLVRPRHPWSAPQGYFMMPEATLESRRNLWFHTGDLLRRDDEGWYHFAGRTKDALRYRGENVSAYEVELVLMAQPEVAEAAVYAVASELGEDEIAAAIVPRRAGVDLAALMGRVAGELPYYAVPRFMRVLEALPKNGSQRVVKAELVAAGLAADVWDREKAGVVVHRNRPRSPDASASRAGGSGLSA